MQQIKFKLLSLRNFMSYGNVPTIVNLDAPGVTLILGKNGAGKTTLMSALVYALYNKTISKVNVDELINDINKKNLEVSIEFEKNGINYKVERVRKGRRFNGKDTWVKLSIEGEDKTSADVEEKIEEIMGMSHDTFIRIVVISALLEPFLKLESAKQRSFVENLFNLTIFSDMAKILNEFIKESKTSIELIQSQIEHLEKAEQRHADQILNAKARVVNWELKNEGDIAILKRTLETMPKVNYAEETAHLKRVKEITDIISRIEDQQLQVKKAEERVVAWEKNHTQTLANVEGTLQSLNGIDFDKESDLHFKYKEITDQIHEIFKQQKALADTIKSYEQATEKHKKNLSLLHDKKCPFCLQEFADVKDKVAEIEKELAKAQDALDTLVNDLAETDNALPALKAERLTVEGNIQIPDFTKMLNSRDQKKLLTQKLADLKEVTNPLVETLEAANDKLKELTDDHKDISKLKAEKEKIQRQTTFQDLDKLIALQNQIQVVSSQLGTLRTSNNPHYEALSELEAIVLEKADYSEINALTVKLEHQQFLYKLLTKGDSFIRKAFINKHLPYLNKQLKKYLSHLPFKVEFTPELTAKITRYGSEIKFDSLSNGQSASVNFGLALAFRDTNQVLHPSINICLLDEVLDFGLDDETVDLASKILKAKAHDEKISMFLISHRGLSKNMFNHAFMIETVKDFSVIKPA
jgi:DNA repair exonuclease SbcCD ATPase subunit